MKLKTRSSAKKRIKITGSKKIRLQKSCKNHLLINKSKRQKNACKNRQETCIGNEAAIKKMLPYG